MKRLLASLVVLAGTASVACYQDDALQNPPAIAPTKVYLTDSPFPFDAVTSVNLYVTKIEGSTGSDTWVTIATPNKSFDLLTLQQGATAFVGQSAIDAGKYVAIRMTIDADQSSIKLKNDTTALVVWPPPGHGLIVFYASVESSLAIPSTGGEIVLDFDVGRTFQYNLYGAHDFQVALGPGSALRAVNSATTGAIAGHVTLIQNGSSAPVPNADVLVFNGYSTLPVATGRTDPSGAYKVGFLPAGSYSVSIEQPSLPWLAAVTTPSVTVTIGATSNLSVVLPTAGGGTSFLRVTGPDSVGTYGSVLLHASVGDSSGHPIANPNVTWFTRDPAIATVAPDTPSVADSLSNAIVGGGVSAGTTWIVATSGTLMDSILMHVIAPGPPPAGIASVTLSPPSLNIAVNDSVYFVATLKDSSGNVVPTGTLYWSILPGQDSTVADVFVFGLQALVRGRRAGSTIWRATEPIHGAHADASITVH